MEQHVSSVPVSVRPPQRHTGHVARLACRRQSSKQLEWTGLSQRAHVHTASSGCIDSRQMTQSASQRPERRIAAFVSCGSCVVNPDRCGSSCIAPKTGRIQTSSFSPFRGPEVSEIKKQKMAYPYLTNTYLPTRSSPTTRWCAGVCASAPICTLVVPACRCEAAISLFSQIL